MDQLSGRTAVVTGGASGIGRALVDRFLAEGMKVVIGDIEEAAIDKTVAEVRAATPGAEVLGVRCDVTDIASVEALAEASYEAYGAVHVLVNNAGVGPPSAKVWETTPNDWRWTFSVNVFGVTNGIMAFVPRMIASGEPGHVINTSSPNGGVTRLPDASIYAASKAAVTTITECLAAQLDAEGTALKASVFYPSGRGLLDTGMWTSDRNRPADLARERPRSTPAMTMDNLREMAAGAGKELPIQPLDELADLVVDGIRAERFIMILPMPTTEEALRSRVDKELAFENPTVVRPLGL